MNVIRSLLFAAISLAAFLANAQSMSGFLDLSQLNRGTKAGQYHIGVGISALPTANFDVVQSWARPPGVDGEVMPLACLTEFTLAAGHVTVIMTDAEKDAKATLSTDMYFMGRHWDDSEKCTPIEGVFSRKITFSGYFVMRSVQLDYEAPAGFEKITAGISVMPFGTTVELQPSIVRGKPVVRNLKTQLEKQMKRGNAEGLYYYISAEAAEGNSEELGRGYIELK